MFSPFPQIHLLYNRSINIEAKSQCPALKESKLYAVSFFLSQDLSSQCLGDVTEQMRFSIVGGLYLYIGGDSGLAVPYERSVVLVARRRWLSRLEGDVDAVRLCC